MTDTDDRGQLPNHPIVLAVGCHPDDIEFMMAGTLLRLLDGGADLHYMNVANGNCGSREYGREELAGIREQEAREAAAGLQAAWYPPIANDLEVLYDIELVRKVAAVVREVTPDIVLTLPVRDYMEDHMNTARIVVTAAFAIAMPNFASIPERATTVKDVALYHALPYGLHDQMMNPVYPHFYIDITDVLERKLAILSRHASQRNWLDDSQKLDSYLQEMVDQAAEVGRRSGVFKKAEGWIRHSPLGYCRSDFNPLPQLLAYHCHYHDSSAGE